MKGLRKSGQHWNKKKICDLEAGDKEKEGEKRRTAERKLQQSSAEDSLWDEDVYGFLSRGRKIYWRIWVEWHRHKQLREIIKRIAGLEGDV